MIIVLIIVGVAITAWAWWQAKRTPKYTGVQKPSTLIGRVGTATTDLDPSGSVHIFGEDWSAVSEDDKPIAKGDSVIVLDVQGLVLKVLKADDA